MWPSGAPMSTWLPPLAEVSAVPWAAGSSMSSGGGGALRVPREMWKTANVASGPSMAKSRQSSSPSCWSSSICPARQPTPRSPMHPTAAQPARRASSNVSTSRAPFCLLLPFWLCSCPSNLGVSSSPGLIPLFFRCSPSARCLCLCSLRSKSDRPSRFCPWRSSTAAMLSFRLRYWGARLQHSSGYVLKLPRSKERCRLTLL